MRQKRSLGGSNSGLFNTDICQLSKVINFNFGTVKLNFDLSNSIYQFQIKPIDRIINLEFHQLNKLGISYFG